jgi:hypothetical protein
VKAKDFSALPSAKVLFIEPMYALSVQNLPKGNEWLYEIKFDGIGALLAETQMGSLFGRGEETFSQTNSRTLPVLANSSHAKPL